MRRARRKAEREERHETPQEPMTPEEFEAYARQQRAILAKPSEKDKWERYQQRKAGAEAAQQPSLVPSAALSAEEPTPASLREDAADTASAKDQADPGLAAGASRTPTFDILDQIRPLQSQVLHARIAAAKRHLSNSWPSGARHDCREVERRQRSGRRESILNSPHVSHRKNRPAAGFAPARTQYTPQQWGDERKPCRLAQQRAGGAGHHERRIRGGADPGAEYLGVAQGRVFGWAQYPGCAGGGGASAGRGRGVEGGRGGGECGFRGGDGALPFLAAGLGVGARGRSRRGRGGNSGTGCAPGKAAACACRCRPRS